MSRSTLTVFTTFRNELGLIRIAAPVLATLTPILRSRVVTLRLSSLNLALLIALGYAPWANASFVIKLKNGNEYITSYYRQEGRQVFFDAYGGVFGIEKSFIAKVERSSVARLIQTDDQVSNLGDTIPRTEKEAIGSSGATPQPKIDTKEAPGDPIATEFNQLSERSKKVYGLLTGEIRVLMKDITDFKNKLSKDSKLFIKYGREFNQAHEISDVVESVLKARTQ